MPPVASLGLAALLGLVACSIQPGEIPGVNVTDEQSQHSAFCDARAVVAAKCTRCHADPPVNGAPFPLVSYDDMTAPSPSSKDPERRRADRMLAAVESDFMPLASLLLDPPVEALTCEEKSTLLAWLRAGAPLPPDGDTSCDDVVPELLGCEE
jgi:uncharacterized membrane protein